MMIRKKGVWICAGILIIIGIVLLLVLGSKPKEEISILNQEGELIATVQQYYTVEDSKMVYCDVVIQEAADVVARQYQCSLSKAKDIMWENNYSIYTYYKEDIQTALVETCKEYKSKFDCGGAITDLEGNIVAAYGHSKENDNINYALHAASPYSALKPLSVYAQAIEKNIIHWSSTYEDSPYKQIESSDGTKRNWPANANGEYSNGDVTIYEAVRKSLNTVAVKCLKDVGVLESIDFLQNNFDIPLSSERYTAAVHDEEEVIGDIAMGYLEAGVTSIDMAGYYQIFATGGIYYGPSAISKICDGEEKVIYTRDYQPKEVISSITADIMLRLLQGVTKTGGTGVEAFCKTTEVAGKTGSADGNAQCWFAGVTPEYSCAIWHGQNYKNMAPVLFSRTMEKVYEQNKELKNVFEMHSCLTQCIYCEESGMGISSNCTLVQMGYYVPGTQLETCNQH